MPTPLSCQRTVLRKDWAKGPGLGTERVLKLVEAEMAGKPCLCWNKYCDGARRESVWTRLFIYRKIL